MTKCLTIIILFNIFYFIGCKSHEESKMTHYIKQEGDTLTFFGSVKSVQTVNYEAINSLGNITKGQIISNQFNPSQESLTFDADGVIIKTSEIHSSGLILESTFENGDLIELRGYKNGNLIELTLFKRVKKIVTERKVYLDSTLFEFEKSTLDKNGKVSKIESFDKEGNTRWTQYAKYYYEQSFLAKEEWFNDKNDLVSQREYDKFGNKIKSIEVLTEIHSKKKDTTYKTFEYSNNKLIGETTSKSGFLKAIQSTKYVYNALGKLIKTATLDKNGLPSETYIANYDKFGNLISYKFIGNPFQDEIEHTIAYEFDKNNNWIKSIEMKGIVPVQITERQIEYN